MKRLSCTFYVSSKPPQCLRTLSLPFSTLSKTSQPASALSRGLVTQLEDQEIQVSRERRASCLQPPSNPIRQDPAIRRILSGKILPQDSCAQNLKHQFIIQHIKINGNCQAVNCDIQQYFTLPSAIQRHRADHWEWSIVQIP